MSESGNFFGESESFGVTTFRALTDTFSSFAGQGGKAIAVNVAETALEAIPFPAGYTDEQAQDAIGTILTDSSSINFTYTDATPEITAVVIPAGVDHNSLANLAVGDVHTQYLLLAPTTSTRNIITPTADHIALTVRPFSSQTADIFVVENNAATLKHFYLENTGHTRIGAQATYTSGAFTYRDSYRLYFDYYFNGSRQNNYIECVPNSPGGQNQAVMNFIVSGQNFFTVSGVSGAGAPQGMTAGGLVIGAGGGATMRTANTAAMLLRGEFNTITLQGEHNTAGNDEIIIKGKNPFGGATASNICAFFSDTTKVAYVTPLGGLILNETGADTDSRFEGDTDANLFFLDASTDRIGIGTATPGSKLDVVGSFQCDSITNDTGLAHGTYTPTLSNVANLDASTAYECQYMRVGNTVTVSGKVDIDPTLTATSTQLGISLPIASNLGALEDCAGVAFASGVAAQGAAILGDVTNNRAQLQYISGDITNQAMYFSFIYQVI